MFAWLLFSFFGKIFGSVEHVCVITVELSIVRRIYEENARTYNFYEHDPSRICLLWLISRVFCLPDI